MKKNLFFLSLSLLWAITAHSQSLMWDTTLGGVRNDRFYAIERDLADNSVYLFGSTCSPNIPDYHAASPSTVASDGWIKKTDAIGTVLWEKAVGTLNNEVITKAKILSNGDIVAIGTISETWPVQLMPTDWHGSNDVFVWKISSAGNIIWEKCFGGSASDGGVDLTIAPDGTIVLLISTSSTDGNLTGTTPQGSEDVAVINIDTAGAVLNVNRYGGTGMDRPFSITNLSSGGFGVTGMTLSSVVHGHNNHATSGTSDVLLMSLDANFDTAWIYLAGTSGNEHGYSVLESSSGDIIVSGLAIVVMPADGDIASYKGSQDGFIASFTSSGVKNWMYTYGGPANDYELRLKKDGAGDIYAYGVTESSSMDVPSNAGNEDAWVFKIDAIGSIVWVVSLGTAYHEALADLLFFSPDNFVAVGEHMESWTWDAWVIAVGTFYPAYELRMSNPVLTSLYSIKDVVVSAYPNPVENELFVSLPSGVKTTGIGIYTAEGQLVLFYPNIPTSSRTLDMSSFAQGLYFVKIQTSLGEKVLKVFKT